MITCAESCFKMEFKKDFIVYMKTAIPLILSGISQMLFTSTSVIFCGQIGTVELAACSLSSVLINVIVFVPCFGFAMACDTLFPQFCVSLVSSAILLNSRYLVAFLITDESVHALIEEYMVLFIPSVFNIIYPVTLINYIAIVLNIIFHWFFMFAFDLKLRGSPLAINISTFCLAMMLIIYIYLKKIHLETWPGWSFECLDEWKLYLKLALPGLSLILIEWSSFEIAVFASGTLGNIELDIMSIAQQILYLFFQFPLGLAIAGNIHIGHLLGANKPAEAKNAARVLQIVSVCLVVCLGVIALATSSLWGPMYSDNIEIIGRTKNLVIVVAFIHLLDGTQGTCSGILRTVGRQLICAIYLFISFYVIGLPIGLSLLLKTSLGLYGYFIGMGFGLVCLIILQLVYIFRINWENEAQKAYECSKKSNDFEARQLDSSNDITTDIITSEMSNRDPKTKPNLKVQILKRVALFTIIFGFFIASFLNNVLVEFKSNRAFSNLTTNHSFVE